MSPTSVSRDSCALKGASFGMPAATIIMGAVLSLSPSHAKAGSLTIANASASSIQVTAVDPDNRMVIFSKPTVIKHGATKDVNMSFTSGKGRIRYTAEQAFFDDIDRGFKCTKKEFQLENVAEGKPFEIKLDCMRADNPAKKKK